MKGILTDDVKCSSYPDILSYYLLQRKSDGEHESSRRLKTQFLIEMEGCGSGNDQLLLIGKFGD